MVKINGLKQTALLFSQLHLRRIALDRWKIWYFGFLWIVLVAEIFQKCHKWNCVALLFSNSKSALFPQQPYVAIRLARQIIITFLKLIQIF